MQGNAKASAVIGHRRRPLTRVHSVGPGDDLQQQRVVGHAGSDRPEVIDGHLQRHGAGVGDQTKGGLHAVDATVGCRNPHRTALVAPQGQVYLTTGYCRRAARRRPAGRVGRVAGVPHPVRLAGLTAAGEAHVLAHGLAEHGGSCVQQTRDHGGVDIRRVTFEHARAHGHRHTGQADVVFERHRPAGQRPSGRPLYLGAHIPGTVRVVRASRRRMGAWRARIAYDVPRHRKGGHAVVRPQVGIKDRQEELEVRIAKVQPQAATDFSQLVPLRSAQHRYAPEAP